VRPAILAALRAAWGVLCLLAFVLLCLAAIVVAAPLPWPGARRAVVRVAARAFLRFPGLRVRVRGLERLPDGAAVVVANHTSYLDGPLLYALLPPRFAFVIKREMAREPFGFLLGRIGSHFVERRARQAGAGDARRVARSAAAGQSLVFFPEGTFGARVGLWRFHAGAFVIAARAGVPVVPVVIRGAREVLPPNEVLPRPGRIEVEILAPVGGPADPARGAAELRGAARSAILARLGEPDLEPEGHAPID
jgi:1-acyl-sn-glycerol-3-phosphate acyltransferase